MLACKNSGFEAADHFIGVNKMAEIGSGAKRKQIDYELSRYFCYLIAQNGDPRKGDHCAWAGIFCHSDPPLLDPILIEARSLFLSIFSQ